MNIEVGKTYQFNHSRKGKFVAKVLQVNGPPDDQFLELAIVDGRARYLTQPDAYEGETITVRASLCTATEL